MPITDTRTPTWLEDPYQEGRHVYGYQHPEHHPHHDLIHDKTLGSILYLQLRDKWAAHVPAFGRGQFDTKEKAKNVVERHVRTLRTRT